MELRCGIFNNMNSGKNRHYRYNKKKFRSFVPDNYNIIDVYSLSDLPSAVHIIKEEGTNLLMVNGGDGTLQRLITALIDKLPESDLPMILPLRGGTANVVAGNIGVRKNPVDAVKILIDYFGAYKRGEEALSTLPVRPLKITDKKYGLKYGFVFTNGLIYKIQQLFYKEKNPTFSTVVNLITTMIGGYVIRSRKIRRYFNKGLAEIYIDGKKYPEDKYLLTIASAFPKFLLWFAPFYNPEAKGVDRFYFLATSVNPWFAIKNLRVITTGRQIPPKTFNGTPERVSIKTNSGYGLDGEMVEDKYTEILIEQGPALKFLIVPESMRTSYGITHKTYINPYLVSAHKRDSAITFSDAAY